MCRTVFHFAPVDGLVSYFFFFLLPTLLEGEWNSLAFLALYTHSQILEEEDQNSGTCAILIEVGGLSSEPGRASLEAAAQPLSLTCAGLVLDLHFFLGLLFFLN